MKPWCRTAGAEFYKILILIMGIHNKAVLSTTMHCSDKTVAYVITSPTGPFKEEFKRVSNII
jgi:hypothetical protein